MQTCSVFTLWWDVCCVFWLQPLWTKERH